MLVKLMVRDGLTFKGIVNLEQKLQKNTTMNDVKDVVKLNTSELQTGMQRKASFKGHWEGKKFIKPTGATKRSITLEMKKGGLVGVVAPQTHYSPYLEYGTRFMTAQPFVKPAFFVQKHKFIKDLSRLVR